MSIRVARHSDSKSMKASQRRSIAEDRRFFDKHPDRCHRMRSANIDDIQYMLAEFGADALEISSGGAMYVVVRQVMPGLFVRNCLIARVGMPVNLPEEFCAELFESTIERGIAGQRKINIFRNKLRGAAS